MDLRSKRFHILQQARVKLNAEIEKVKREYEYRKNTTK